MTRRILSLLCALVMLISVSCVQAENADNIQAATSESFADFYRIPDTLYYKGGTVIRGFFKGADTSAAPLDLAYILTSMPYIILGTPSTWEVTISGGEAPYGCQVLLAHQDLSLDPFDDKWKTATWFYLDDNTFDYTFTTPGRYFWEFRVMDEGGQFFSFQTRIYETFTEENETDATTVPGKVNSLIEELITPEMSDYSRALVLHDWLIYNANYDYSDNPYRDASGVLLHGAGVCDSYARAYLMLCTAAGLECMYISGTAYSGGAWGNHGWNLVKLDGSWYHVDCTWDDPGTGGSERHKYFCVDDETMAKDHRWNRPDDIFDSNGYIPPEAEGGEFENEDTAAANYHYTFASLDELDAGLENLIASGQLYEVTYAKYTGPLDSLNFYYDYFLPWIYDKVNDVYARGYITSAGVCGIRDGLFYYTLYWKNPTSYIQIEESSLRLSIGEESIIIPTHYYPVDDVYSWTSSDPSVATVSADIDSEAGLLATITAVSAGEATITVSSQSGASDHLTVTVLPAFKPDFGFNAATDSEGVTLSWESIPGVTEYQVYRRIGSTANAFSKGSDTLLITTNNTRVYLTKDQLPDNVQSELYIVGLRIVAGQTTLSYTSEPITYGKLTLSYNTSLPGALTAIDAEAFYGNTSLTSLRIPGKVTVIGERAFYGCTSLTTVRIPASVTSIGDNAFEGCPLKYAEVSEDSYAESWLLKHFPNITLVY